MRVQMRLFGDVADAALVRGEIVVDAAAVVKDLPVGWVDQPGQYLDGGAFAGAVRAQVAKDFAWLYRETDAAHRDGVLVILCERARFEHGSLSPLRHRSRPICCRI